MSLRIDPRLLESFVVLCEELHYARAARRLHIAQSTLSLQIMRLEAQVGVELFNRRSRPIELSPAGEALMTPAAEALARIAQGVEAAVRAGQRAPALRVAVESDIEDHWIDVLNAWSREHGRRINVQRLHEWDLTGALRDGRVEAAIHWTPPERSGFRATHIGDAAVLIAMDDSHPLTSRRSLCHQDIIEHTFVLWERDDEPELWDDYADRLTGGQPTALQAIGVNSMDRSQKSMVDAVRATDRLTIVTRHYWGSIPQEGLATRPLENVAVPVYWSNVQSEDAAADAIGRTLRAAGQRPAPQVNIAPDNAAR